MKIEISGNFGEGKTTLATLLYQLLREENFNVSVEDGSTTNFIKQHIPIHGKEWLDSRNVEIVVRNDLSKAPDRPAS